MDEVLVLGTSSAFPTKTRNHPAVYVLLDGKHILLDCGEGTQRQIRLSGLSPSLDSVFLTHWHGDHSLGLGGLIQSLNMMGSDRELHVYGPPGTGKRINRLLKTYEFYSRINVMAVDINAPKERRIASFPTHDIFSINVKHVVKCLGYKVKEKDTLNIREDLLVKYKIKSGPFLKKLKAGKNVVYNGKTLLWKKFTYPKKGKTFVYLTDLIYDGKLSRFADGADALLIESTFTSDSEDKARESFHLTVKQALEIAKAASVKRLYLTHISQRYEDTDKIMKDATHWKERLKCKFDVSVAQDFTKIRLS
jgi:ribonuclease Z